MMFLVLSHTINVCSLIQNYLCSLINYYISANNLQCNLFITVNGTTAERGSTVQAVVLDVAKTERLVDLSLKPEFLDRHKEDSSNSQADKKKRRREAHKELQPHQTVNVTVEVVKEN